MKDRQRWQPEEDALLRAYVKQYGPKEWNLISQRMGKPLHRDPKSCLERWKNYLKPGLKKGSLTADEQTLVISLQAKYGNKWKKIAAEVPGRTAKRLGKWWEVFKEKQLKQLQKAQNLSQRRELSDPEGNIPIGSVSSPEKAVQGPYDHILETFAEKYVQPKLYAAATTTFQPSPLAMNIMARATLPEPDPVLSLGSITSATTSSAVLPVWMNVNPTSIACTTSSLSSSTSSTTPSPSVSLTLSPSEPVFDFDMTRFFSVQQMGTLIQYCKDLDEGRQSWMQHKKEATWRLCRLEQQLESEKARKMREKTEEIEAKIKSLREEETAFIGRIEHDMREELNSLQKEAESKESKLLETWCIKQGKLAKLIEKIGGQTHHGLLPV